MRRLPQILALSVLAAVAASQWPRGESGDERAGALAVVSRPAVPSGMRPISHDWLEPPAVAAPAATRERWPSLQPPLAANGIDCQNGAAGSPCRNCQIFALLQRAF